MTLKQYIEADPDKLGLAALVEIGNDEEIARLISAPSLERGNYISRSALEVALLGLGVPARCKLLTLSTPTTDAERALWVACQSLLDLLASREFPELDLSNSATVAMMGGLVAGGILTSQQSAAITALASPAQYSIADREGFGVVDSVAVSLAIDRTPVPSEQVGHGPGVFETDEEWQAALAAEQGGN